MSNSFQTLRERLPIHKVMERFGVKVLRSSMARCPFHSEKTPSFKIYLDTNSFYCFGCGIGGDQITLVKLILRFNSNEEAARYLDNEFNLGLFESNLESKQKHEMACFLKDKNYISNFDTDYLGLMMKFAGAMRIMDKLKKEVKPINLVLIELRGFIDNNWEQMDNLFWEYTNYTNFIDRYEIYKLANVYLNKMRKLNLI